MTALLTYAPKVAWIRNPNVPPGQPAPGHLNCLCGHSPETRYMPEQGNVTCACGQEYTWDGRKIVDPNIEAWPYDDIAAAWRSHDPRWRETTLETYYNQLGAVPPIRMGEGYFMVGERFTADAGGFVYAVFGMEEGRFFCRLDYSQHYKPSQYRAEIVAQFDLTEAA